MQALFTFIQRLSTQILSPFTFLTTVILNLIYFFALSRTICTPAVQKDFEPFFWSSAANYNMNFRLFFSKKIL